jgi:hypothetical protein
VVDEWALVGEVWGSGVWMGEGGKRQATKMNEIMMLKIYLIVLPLTTCDSPLPIIQKWIYFDDEDGSFVVDKGVDFLG